MSNSSLSDSSYPDKKQRQMYHTDKLYDVFKSSSEYLANAIIELSSTETYRTVSDQVISISDALDKVEARKVKIQSLLDSNAMKVRLLETIDSTTFVLYSEFNELSED